MQPDPAIAERLTTLVQTVFGAHGAPMLAEELGIRFSVFSGYMSGRTPLPDNLYSRICAAAGNASEEWLRNGVGSMLPPLPGEGLEGLGGRRW